jgi:regulator of sigma D
MGAVLENGLRRICGNNNLTVKSDDNISALNQKLADKEVYNRLQQREIEAWNKLRDYADHGHFDEYDAEKVRKMLEGVRSFLASQPS